MRGPDGEVSIVSWRNIGGKELEKAGKELEKAR